jgi:peptidoglycan L-alanyl-D-glutamate endopeptidase CwlK
VKEPPINRDPTKLDIEFRNRLAEVMKELVAINLPFRFHEGFRTVERQQWLYGQGRPSVKYGRKGSHVTNHDGVLKRSYHQSGRAADLYPLDRTTGKLIWPPPPSPDPVWEQLTAIAELHGLTAGYRWRRPHDPPHIELRK